MWNSDCYYSCVGSTVSETMTGHERKRQSLSGKQGDAARQNRAFHHSAAKVVLLYSPPPWQSLTSVSYLKQKCNALPPTPPLPLPLSLTEESLRSTWEKAPELRGWFYFFFQHEMDLMLALLVPSPQPAATDGKISFLIVIFWSGENWKVYSGVQMHFLIYCNKCAASGVWTASATPTVFFFLHSIKCNWSSRLPNITNRPEGIFLV